jgi:hypothetical protein
MSRGKQLRKRLVVPQEIKQDRPNIFIAITTVNEFIFYGLAEVLIQWAVSSEFDFAVNFIAREKPLDSARNMIVNRFLSMDAENFTHLCMIDNDIKPKPDTMTRLLAADKDVICPLIFSLRNDENAQTTHPIPLIFKKINDNGDMQITTDVEGIAETANIAGGFMLIKREVIENVKKPAFRYGYKQDGVVNCGTDTYFSKAVEEAGYKLFIDTAAEADQVGLVSLISYNNALIDCAEKFSRRGYKELMDEEKSGRISILPKAKR